MSATATGDVNAMCASTLAEAAQRDAASHVSADVDYAAGIGDTMQREAYSHVDAGTTGSVDELLQEYRASMDAMLAGSISSPEQRAVASDIHYINGDDRYTGSDIGGSDNHEPLSLIHI